MFEEPVHAALIHDLRQRATLSVGAMSDSELIANMRVVRAERAEVDALECDFEGVGKGRATLCEALCGCTEARALTIQTLASVESEAARRFSPLPSEESTNDR